MKNEDVKKLTGEEIGAELASLRERLFTLRTQTVTEKVEDNSHFRKHRKDVARLLTERSARRLKQDPKPARIVKTKPVTKARPIAKNTKPATKTKHISKTKQVSKIK